MSVPNGFCQPKMSLKHLCPLLLASLSFGFSENSTLEAIVKETKSRSIVWLSDASSTNIVEVAELMSLYPVQNVDRLEAALDSLNEGGNLVFIAGSGPIIASDILLSVSAPVFLNNIVIVFGNNQTFAALAMSFYQQKASETRKMLGVNSQLYFIYQEVQQTGISRFNVIQVRGQAFNPPKLEVNIRKNINGLLYIFLISIAEPCLKCATLQQLFRKQNKSGIMAVKRFDCHMNHGPQQ